MTTFKAFASFVLAVLVISTLSAETRCPETPEVYLPHGQPPPDDRSCVDERCWPFSFLLDTGTQMTMVDPALATALHLETTGKAEVAGVGMLAAASFAQADLVEAGPYSVANQKVLVYDLANLQATGLKIQGVLGEDFLEQFDMLIYNSHYSLVCLDDSAMMRAEVKGSRIPLLARAVPGVTASQLAHRCGSPVRRHAPRPPQAGHWLQRPLPLQHF